MTRRHENYSEKIRQVELFNFKDIQNYYAAKLFKQSSRKNNSSATVFFFFFKFYVLMQSKTMKYDAIYLNSSIEVLCVC